MDTKNISMGVHTFSFCQRLTAAESFVLGGDFNSYARNNSNMKRYPIDKNNPERGWEYAYKNSIGIRWRLLSRKVNDNLTIYGLYVIITPRVLIGKDYIGAATETDMEKVEVLFNSEASKISPLIRSFGSCSMNRSDPCINFDLDKLKIPCTSEQMFTLIKRGDMPGRHYSERTEYDTNARRWKVDKNNFYLESKSVTVNCYPKDKQIESKNPNCPDKEKAANVIRFEIQCKYPKLRSLAVSLRHKSKYYKSADEIPDDEYWEIISTYYPRSNSAYPADTPIYITNPSNPIDVLLSDTVSAGIIRKYFNKVIHPGDYLTLDGARWMVEAHNFRRDKKERLIWALELINECRGIAKAKSKLPNVDLDDFKRSLDDLDSILVNPATIPRDWKIEHIPNLLRAYYDSITVEQLIPYNEFLFKKLLAEYLGT